MRHGVLSSYRRGCRCEECRTVANTYQKRLRYDHGRGVSRLVDSRPVQEHITRLRESGMTWGDIATALGYTATPTVQRFMRKNRIRRSTAERVMAIQPHTNGGQGFVNSVGARRRLQALMRIGHSQVAMAERIGVTAAAVSDIIHGKYKNVRGYVHDAIVDMYREWENVDGTSSMSRTIAEKRGYAPPAAWDWIDDPREKAQGVVK